MIFRIHQSAQVELDDATAWYERESLAAAQRFASAFRNLVADIAKMPDRFPPVRREARQAKLRQFPYYVIFASDPDSITILAGAHFKRRPGYWHGRLA